ncbi:MAG: hypothetical protein LPK47_02675 [Bacteroidota bacterium]|nr:hypothetical protein [Bacteroidota bacterium]
MKKISNKDLIIEAINESIHISSISLKTEKENGDKWIIADGVFGYPALIILFSVVDSIGSYFRVKSKESNGIEIPFSDGEKRKIIKPRHHFYILNHPSLFDCKLSKEQIDDLYKAYRCKITHNQSIPIGRYLFYKLDFELFYFQSNKLVGINLHKFNKLVSEGANKFTDMLYRGNLSPSNYTAGELRNSSLDQVYFSSLGIALPSDSSGTTNDNL